MLLCICHLHDFPDVNQLSGQLPVTDAGRGIAGGMIVDEYQGCRFIFKRPFHDFTRRNETAVHRAFKEVGHLDDLILAAEVNDLGHIVTIHIGPDT